MKEYEWANIVVSISPSYWADIPGQFKVFIDRCTPWCNTHEPHEHLEIESCGNLGLCFVEYKEDVAGRIDEILDFCNMIIEE